MPDQQTYGPRNNAQKNNPEGHVVDRLRPAPDWQDGSEVADDQHHQAEGDEHYAEGECSRTEDNDCF